MQLPFLPLLFAPCFYAIIKTNAGVTKHEHSATFLIVFILAVTSLFIPENLAAPIFFTEMGVLYVACIVLIYNKLRSGFRWAKFYVFSWIPLIIGAAIQPMELTGFLPYSFATRHAFLAAILCEVILMAMALADRVRYQRERCTLPCYAYSAN